MSKHGLSIKERFELYVKKEESGCWLWIGGKKDSKRDYGVLQIRRRGHRAHRVSMHIYNGFDLDSPYQINHECNNPLCVNPDHLYIGTQSDNMKDWHRTFKHLIKS